MTPPLFFAVVDATHSSGPIDSLRETFQHFGVEWKYILIQLASFLIVLGVLYKFAIKPTIAAITHSAGRAAASSTACGPAATSIPLPAKAFFRSE
mgnify:CR=1 FL=1